MLIPEVRGFGHVQLARRAEHTYLPVDPRSNKQLKLTAGADGRMVDAEWMGDRPCKIVLSIESPSA